MRKVLKLLASWAPGNHLRLALLRACGYSVGQQVYVGPGLIIADELEGEGNDVVIRDRVSIGPRVTIVTASSPNDSRLEQIIGKTKGPVTIDEDAWVGAGAILLPNVTVGAMSIVGAGAVVTESVPPRSTAVGVPARVVKKVDDRK
jgi:maltose O-acetyltransferase